MDFEDNTHQNELEYQRLIISEFNDREKIKPIPFRLGCTRFVIPQVLKYNETTVSLNGHECKYKQLVFSSLYAITYQAFFSDTLAVTLKNECRGVIPDFIDYLNNITIYEDDRINILKDYEKHRVVNDGVKTQSTNVDKLMKFIRQSLNYQVFLDSLDLSQFNYLNELTNTKVAPTDEVEQFTLTSWFSFHSWLRREDIGIGNDLYMRLASPKALITSFRFTSEISLLKIQEAKHALIAFFQANNITAKQLIPPKSAPQKGTLEDDEYKRKTKEWKSYIHPFIATRFKFLQEKYFSIEKPSKPLKFAYEIIVYSWCHESAIEWTLELFFKNKEVTRDFYGTQRFIVSDTWLFSHNFLYELAKYADDDKASRVPVCNTEHLFFQWLMAYQSVQTTDIPKLRLDNFNFVRRRNGGITHIESEYFKGRANDTHHLKSILANTSMGKAIVNFFNDRSKNVDGEIKELTISIKGSALTMLKKGNVAKITRLIHRSNLRGVINDDLQKNKATSVFIEALHAIVENGLCYSTYSNNTPKEQRKSLTRGDWLLNCENSSSKRLFSLTSIKNSSIHARSSSFTPTQLQNFNSHSDETERKDYRTEDNYEWSNNCGRVVRAVMQDMHINVFSPSKSEIQSFNSDFTRASTIIDMRKENVLSRLKLVSGKNSGRVDEIGFLKEIKILPGDQADSLYLVDSPETIMRFYHYIDEVENKHKQLRASSLEYLLFTVLPTVEWMSILLTERRFCADSLQKGKVLFDQYRNILPSNFSASL